MSHRSSPPPPGPGRPTGGQVLGYGEHTARLPLGEGEEVTVGTRSVPRCRRRLVPVTLRRHGSVVVTGALLDLEGVSGVTTPVAGSDGPHQVETSPGPRNKRRSAVPGLGPPRADADGL